MMPVTRNVHPKPYFVELKRQFLALEDSLLLRIGPGLTDSEVIAVFKELTQNFSAGIISLEVRIDYSLPEFCAVSGEAQARIPDSEWSYGITVDDSGIALNAADLSGLRYAYYTFLQLLQRRGEERVTGYAIPYCSILDRPAMQFRGVHVALMADIPLETIEKLLIVAAFTKYNYAVLEPWGAIRLDNYPGWHDVSVEKAQLAGTIKKLRAMGMEIIPQWNSLGHATCSFDSIGKNMMLEVNPALESYIEPYGFDWCLTNPATPKLLRAIRSELCELCGPGTYFHIGGDESYFLATCDNCSAEPFIPMVGNFLNDMCADIISAGRRPIIWSDMLLNPDDWKGRGEHTFANSTKERPTHELLQSLDRRFVIADWQYDSVTFPEPTAEHFKEKGFSTLLCPWRKEGNIDNLAKTARATGIDGVLLTLWHWAVRLFPNIAASSDMLWGNEERMPFQPTLISTELLRKLCPSDGYYMKSGWMDQGINLID